MALGSIPQRERCSSASRGRTKLTEDFLRMATRPERPAASTMRPIGLRPDWWYCSATEYMRAQAALETFYYYK